MSRFGLDVALDTIGVVFGKLLCNFSTYQPSGGGAPVDVDYTKRAPLNFESTFPIDVITADIDYDPNVDDLMSLDLFGNSFTNTDRFFVMYDSADANRYIRISWSSSGGGRLLCQAQSAITGVVSSFGVAGAIPPDQRNKVGFRSSGIGSAKTFVSCLDGNEVDPEIVDWTGTKFDKIVMGANYASSGGSPNMLVYGLEAILLGNVNFVSNADDGTVFMSDSGTIFTASDEIPLTLQYPNYTPDPDDIVSSPATGPIHIRTAAIPSDILTANVNIDLTKDLNIDLLLSTLSPVDSGDRYLELYDSTDIAKYVVMYWYTGGLLAVAVNNGGSGISAVAGIIQGETPQELCANFTGPQNAKVFSAEVDGVLDPTPAVIDMTGMTLDRLVVGTRRGGATLMDMDLYRLSSNQLGNINFVGRIWGVDDPNGNKYIGSATTENPAGVTMTLDDQAEESAVSPYTIGKWDGTTNGAYLVSDKQLINGACVTIPAGEAIVYDKDTDEALYDKDTGEIIFDKDGV